MMEFKPFDASTVELSGSNLIEASAGTGKTYSIALLVLRLVLEKQFSVKEILMVTFTKAAVAELQERIRLFIRKAYKASQGETIDDKAISQLVKQQMKEQLIPELQQKLRDAVLLLDETAVMTIHSFCQLTLSEFAFETDQIFGAETLPDANSVLADEVNKFWRENITTIPSPLLRHLVKAGISRESITKLVQQHLSGKMYFGYEKHKSYSFCQEDHDKIIAELEEIDKSQKRLEQEMYDYVKHHAQEIREKSEKNSHAKRARLHLVDKPEDLIKMLKAKRHSAYIDTVYADVMEHCVRCENAAVELEKKLKEAISDIYCQAINSIAAGLEQYKQRNNFLSFDDMIINLHRALTARPNRKLVDALQRKYKAVFVDEFQDTDRLQYEVFQQAFHENTVLFYIGDPKQSIYAFRKADIFTYFKAKETVEKRYTMNQNFRSSTNFIEAMNQFFEPIPGFDSFAFNNAPEAINYHPVQSPSPNTKGILKKDGQECTPISISEAPTKDEINAAVLEQIIDLLSNPGYQLEREGESRNISPADIGILVRMSEDGKKLKAMLADHGIPAVFVNEQKVLQSEEAEWLLYLLEAMIESTRNTVNKALLSPLTGYNKKAILSLSDETAFTLFRKYRNLWLEDGVYAALTDLLTDFDVKQTLLKADAKNGERTITNLLQLIELLHRVQSTKQFSPLELLSWLKRCIEGMATEGDEYEQRIETDAESIQIITIHKSKGLEYNIVFAPFLDLHDDGKQTLCSYRDPASGQYIVIEKDKMDGTQQQLVREQNEQENRRLVYVAITRAVFTCFLHHSTREKDSTLNRFLQAIDFSEQTHIKRTEAPAIHQKFRYRGRRVYQENGMETPVDFALEQNNWTKMSYTMLAKKGEILGRPAAAFQQDRYDEFMFRQLVRGNKTGNLLHQIFEQVHFNDEKNWSYIIDLALKQHLPKQRETYLQLLTEMLRQILFIKIGVNGANFSLSEISFENRIHEFEFDFLAGEYNPLVLNQLSDENMEIRVAWDTPLQGILNGKMDLFFGHEGKFYILDWKSNYLGDKLSDYSPASLALAMNENNYHLQYLIYTVAAKKYLESRMPFFDYEEHFGGVVYLFVRGVRAGRENGIYVNRPTLRQVSMLEKILDRNKLAAI